MQNIPTLLSCTGNETKCGLVIGTGMIISSSIVTLILFRVHIVYQPFITIQIIVPQPNR